MGRSSKRVCDNCDKESTDPLFECAGWITFESKGIKITVSNGTAFLNKKLNEYRLDSDFCSFKCLEEFLTKQ